MNETLALEGGTPFRADFLMFHRPSIGVEEEAAVVEVLRSGWLTTGAKTKEFERRFAEFSGVAEGVGVNSCTAAMHLALIVAGIGEGDEVITSPMSWPASANVIIHAGARPVFADVDRATFNISAEAIEATITPRTKALIPVHIAGVACDMDAIREVADAHNLVVISDAAHAIETEYGGRKIAELSDMAAFSFYATKNVTTGEGGMLTTSNEEWADKARIMALHGISRDAWKRYTEEGYKHWEVVYPGFKYNMFDLQAALGLVQLAKVEQLWQRRRRLVERYRAAFSDVPEVEVQALADGNRSAYHLMIIVLTIEMLSADRDVVMAALQAENVGVGVHFRAIHLQPWYRKEYGYEPGSFIEAEYLSDRVLSLPLFPDMSDGDVDSVVGALKKVLAAYR